MTPFVEPGQVWRLVVSSDDYSLHVTLRLPLHGRWRVLCLRTAKVWVAQSLPNGYWQRLA